MLKRIRRKKLGFAGGAFAIVASKYNAKYVNGMLRAALAELKQAGAPAPVVVRVPGAYEIPVVAARLAAAKSGDTGAPQFAAIICLGVILRGETAHADLIAEAITHGLTRIQLDHGVPVIHEVLLLDNEQQAKVRCLSREHNRGREAAQTALQIAQTLASLSAAGN
ncbi:MAG: 6,7-dimethyl-8-ribityllumazine synthase [Verrucomicrobiae bacterium]|nr:6,7-dimethyl-8-ribityllumazine synthase [Verrucomicrobiae bacterium]MDW7979271.1 6,7-dimethyl-8-ribityllumazine synthase [Verrucomicrobiales bacterium]